MVFETKFVFKTRLKTCLNAVLKIKTRVNVKSLFMLRMERLLNMEGNTTEEKLTPIYQCYVLASGVICCMQSCLSFCISFCIVKSISSSA